MSQTLDRLDAPSLRSLIASLVGAVVACSSLACGQRLENAVAGQEKPSSAESWESIFLGGSKVGHGQTVRRWIDRDGESCLEIRNTSRLAVKRFGQSVTQDIRLVCVETRGGQLVDFTTELVSGSSRIATTGRRAQDRLIITTDTQDKRTTEQLEWKDAYGGFFAVEESIRRQPPQPGEKRHILALLPIFNQLSTIKLEAMRYEATRLLEGDRELLKVQTTTKLEGVPSIVATLWVDSDGSIWKTQLAGIGQVTYRSTKDVALQQAKDSDFDLGDYTVIRLKERLHDPHSARRIVYRARLKGGDPSGVFPSDLSQKVRSLGEDTAEIDVRAVRPGSPPDVSGVGSGFTPEDLASNNLVQSDNAVVRQMAARVAGDERDAWRVSKLLEKHVHNAIRVRDFSQALATAAEVAQSLEGDCTEHAVLLAALCRARDIPARVAVGLVYSASQQGFAYHMWNEVWIKDRWIPLDATLGRGGIGAGHLKLAVSDLRGTKTYNAFIPVFQVLGQLQLEVVRVDD